VELWRRRNPRVQRGEVREPIVDSKDAYELRTASVLIQRALTRIHRADAILARRRARLAPRYSAGLSAIASSIEHAASIERSIASAASKHERDWSRVAEWCGQVASRSRAALSAESIELSKRNGNCAASRASFPRWRRKLEHSARETLSYERCRRTFVRRTVGARDESASTAKDLP